MRIQQIRNATIRIVYAGKTFLIDPWLAEQGAMGTFATTPFRCLHPEQADIPMPMVSLPLPVRDILHGLDACIVTHVHPDHIDIAADGTVGAVMDKQLPLFAQNAEDAETLKRSGFAAVTVLTEATACGEVRLIKTPGLHGTKIPCGPSCGVIFKHASEVTLYVAGDTIWYEGVAEILRKYRPHVVVLNACAAALMDYGRLIMDDGDVEAVYRACPGARIIVSHMDTVAHAAITRADMVERLKQRRILHNAVIPSDGEMLTF